MFKKAFAILLSLTMLFLSSPRPSSAASSLVETSSLPKGVISFHYTQGQGVGALVRITKDNVKYDYPYIDGAQYPLQLGDGDYSILIAESIDGSKYKVVAQETVTLKLEHENEVFLQSIPLINWNPETKAVLEAKKLTSDSATDEEKVTAIYKFVTANLKYDYDKASSVKAGYLPNLDEIFDSSKGICYDYAATFAAMSRSIGIPTRLVMGYEASSPDTYHAWNQVYLNSEWKTIDSTYDASDLQSGQSTPMYKNADDYTPVQYY